MPHDCAPRTRQRQAVRAQRRRRRRRPATRLEPRNQYGPHGRLFLLQLLQFRVRPRHGARVHAGGTQVRARVRVRVRRRYGIGASPPPHDDVSARTCRRSRSNAKSAPTRSHAATAQRRRRRRRWRQLGGRRSYWLQLRQRLLLRDGRTARRAGHCARASGAIGTGTPVAPSTGPHRAAAPAHPCTAAMAAVARLVRWYCTATVPLAAAAANAPAPSASRRSAADDDSDGPPTAPSAAPQRTFTWLRIRGLPAVATRGDVARLLPTTRIVHGTGRRAVLGGRPRPRCP